MRNRKNLKPENQQVLPGFEDAVLEANGLKDSGSAAVRSLDCSKPRENRVSIRVSAEDLSAVKKLALISGTPYHSLLSRIIHEYVNANGESKEVKLEDVSVSV